MENAKVRLTALLLGLGGLTLATVLIAWSGVMTVFGALATAGWGLLVVALFHLVPMFFDTLGWYVLFERAQRPSFRSLLWIRWVREGVDNLLPVAQVGGELVATRLLVQRGTPGAVAGATVVLDLTFAVVTQLLFTIAGLGLLVWVTGGQALVEGVLSGVALGAAAVAGFVLMQRRGLFELLVSWLSGMAGGRRWLGLVGGAARLDAAVDALYRRPRVLAGCAGWLFIAWVVGAGEVWLALYFLGHPVSLAEALLLESLGQAARSAAFAVPGSLGVQEGGYMVLGTLLGLAPETGLAVSLARRVRELLLGVPALLQWQWIEGRRLLRRRGERGEHNAG